MKRTTIRDVAKEAGVSVTTVSFVMSNKKCEEAGMDKKYCVVEETTEKVLQAVDKLGYRPNAAASSLRNGGRYNIGVITSDIANQFFSDIARAIENVAYKSGNTVLFSSSDESASKMESIVDTFLDNSVEGMIIAPCNGSQAVVKKVIDAGIPTVLFDRDLPELKCGRVLLDNVRAGEMAVDLLYDAGFRNIEMINYSLGISSMDEREVGYRKAMEKHGLASNINVGTTVYGEAEQDIRDFISESVRRGADAMIFPTNTISVIGLKVIHELGIDVPKQMAVVCFDKSSSYDLYSPRITRITQSTDEMAIEAFNMLKRIIDNPDDSREERLILQPEIILRESTLPQKQTTMRQAVLLKPETIQLRKVRSITPDSLQQDQVLIHIMRIGICGSEVHSYHGTHPATKYPVVQGHEYSGIVVGTGSRVTKVKVGDKVTARPQEVCGHCNPCRHGLYNVCENLKVEAFQADGAAQDYFIVPEDRVVLIPEKMSLDYAAMVEPVAVAAHVTTRPHKIEGANVVVSGAGTIGNLVAQFALARGAAKVCVTDISDNRLEKARQCGVEYTVNVAKTPLGEAVGEIFGDEGFQIGIECAGVESSVRSLMECIEKGGDVVIVGVHSKDPAISMFLLGEHGLSLIGSMMYRHEDYLKAVEMIDCGKINLAPLITERFPLEKYDEAYRFIDAHRDSCMKVMIDLTI